MMKFHTLELYRGYTLRVPIDIRSDSGDYTGMTVKLRVWLVADEPIADDAPDEAFAVAKDLPAPDDNGASVILISAAESAELTVGEVYRFRVDTVTGGEIVPLIGGRLYVGAKNGQ